MIRKSVIQIAAPALLVFMAVNSYLAFRHLERIQRSESLTWESSDSKATVAAILQDLTDMETGQRGYLLTEDTSYLQPYTEAKGRIGTHFSDLRSAFAKRSDSERASETLLETLAGSRQVEMDRTIGLRQQGYRHRAFLLVGTNEGKEYMDRIRGLAASLFSTETERFSRFEDERRAILKRAFSETILANTCLLMLTSCLFLFVRYHGRSLEQEGAEARGALSARNSELERLKSALGNQARSNIMAIEENARFLLDEYGSFLPRQGNEYIELIKDAAIRMEELRKNLLGTGESSLDQKAA
jgi:CHASE3 domain sensor protein